MRFSVYCRIRETNIFLSCLIINLERKTLEKDVKLILNTGMF